MTAQARLGRYALWQLRDYAFGAGGATVVLACALAWIGANTLSVNGRQPSSFEWLVGLVAFFGSVFAASGLIADDRTHGYYRFQFAKPVHPIRFYAQAYVTRGLWLVALVALIDGLGVLTDRSVPIVGSLAFIVVQYILVGGVTLLLSLLGRFAWLVSCVLYAMSILANRFYNVTVGGWHALWVTLHFLLPPFHLSEIAMVETPQVWWSVGYGVLSLVATAIVLRRREWAR